MKINIYKLKEENLNNDYIKNIIYDSLVFISENNLEDIKNDIRYETILSLGFLKEKNNFIYPNLLTIKEYDIHIYEEYLSYLLTNYIFKEEDLMSSNNNLLFDELETISEDDYMKYYHNNDDTNVLLYDSYYAKSLNDAGFLEIRGKKTKLIFKKNDLNTKYYNVFLENAISMIISEGILYNNTVYNYLVENDYLIPT